MEIGMNPQYLGMKRLEKLKKSALVYKEIGRRNNSQRRMWRAAQLETAADVKLHMMALGSCEPYSDFS